MAAEMRGDFFAANEQARIAIALADDPSQAGGAYSYLTENMVWIDPDEAERLLEAAPRWTKPLGSRAHNYICALRGMLAAARQDYEEALRLFKQGDLSGFAAGLPSGLLAVHLLRGDVSEATAILERDAASAVGWVDYFEPLARARIASRSGDHCAAHAHLREAVARVRRWKVPLGLADCVVGCAVDAFHAGDPERASELLAAVQAATGGGLRTPASMIAYRHYRRAVRGALDQATVARARAAGAALTLEAALARELNQ
jgi:hypothetical protein